MSATTYIEFTGNATQPLAVVRDRAQYGQRRLLFQWERRSGVTAATFVVRGRTSPSMAFVDLTSQTSAGGVVEVTTCPEMQIAISGFTGTGTVAIAICDPD